MTEVEKRIRRRARHRCEFPRVGGRDRTPLVLDLLGRRFAAADFLAGREGGQPDHFLIAQVNLRRSRSLWFCCSR